jgi:hypothetical protein
MLRLAILQTSHALSILWIELVGDAFIIARSLSPPYEYIEGGDFRDTLTLQH